MPHVNSAILLKGKTKGGFLLFLGRKTFYIVFIDDECEVTFVLQNAVKSFTSRYFLPFKASLDFCDSCVSIKSINTRKANKGVSSTSSVFFDCDEFRSRITSSMSQDNSRTLTVTCFLMQSSMLTSLCQQIISQDRTLFLRRVCFDKSFRLLTESIPEGFNFVLFARQR